MPENQSKPSASYIQCSKYTPIDMYYQQQQVEPQTQQQMPQHMQMQPVAYSESKDMD